VAAQTVAGLYAHCSADRAAGSAAHYLAVARCLGGRAGDSAAAHCPAALRSPGDYFVEHYFAERCLAAAWADSRSAAGLGDCLHLAEESSPAEPEAPS